MTTIDEVFAMRAAPARKFRVLLVDTFASPPLGEPTVVADCNDKETAVTIAKSHGAPGQPCYVYNDAGEFLFGAGRP